MLLQILKRRWRFAAISFLLLAYSLTIMFVAEKDGDFVHLWVGARTVTSGQGAALYDPAVHYDIPEASHVDAEEFWGPRYDIVGVMFYPPFAALLYTSVSWLSLYGAQVATGVLNIAAGVWAAWMLWRMLNGRLAFAGVMLLLFTFPPFFYSFALGQNGIFTLALTLTSWELLRQRRGLAAGVALSWLNYKPNWLAAFGWFPLVMRHWRMLAGIVLGGVVLTGITAVVVGIQPFIDYIGVFVKTANLHNLPRYPLETQYSVLSIFRRYLGLGSAADLLGWGSALTLVGLTGWLLGVRMQGKLAADNLTFRLQAALAWTTAVVLNPHLHHYDLLLVSAALICALTEWPQLARNQRLILGSLFVVNHFGFVLIDILGIHAVFPLPTFGMLALWGWLFARVYQLASARNATVEPPEPAESPIAIHS